MLKKYYKWSIFILLPFWVYFSFLLSQLVAVGIIWLLKQIGAPITLINKSVFEATCTAFIYLLTLAIVIFVPMMAKKVHTNMKEIGLDRLPIWTEIFIAPAGLVIYLILSAVLMYIGSKIIPGFVINQAQEVGFSQLSRRYEYILAFGTLVVLAPFAEEVLFRGYLFGKLKKQIPVWVAILVTSAVFGAFHGAWNIAIDTFALSIILCVLRQITGSIWPSIVLHMIKNSIAFYILFINPSFITSLLK